MEAVINHQSDKIFGNCDKVIDEAFELVLYNLHQNGILKDDEHVYINIYGDDTAKSGSSLSLAIYASVLAKVKGLKINDCVFSAELNLNSEVGPVGQLHLKLKAAKMMNLKRVFIAKANHPELNNYLDDYKGLEIIVLENVKELEKYL